MRYIKISLWSIFVLLIFAMLIPLNARASERWESLGSDYDGFIYSFDKQTIEYNNVDNTITFWYKTSNNGKTDSLSQEKIFLNTKQSHSLKYVSYRNGYPQTPEDVSVSASYKPVIPDTDFEKIANYICDVNNVKHIYAGGDDRWHWLESTDTTTTTIAIDALEIDGKNQKIRFFTKTDMLPDHYFPDGKTTFAYRQCDFKNKTIGEYSWKGWSERIVLPDTLDEKIYNAAKNIYQNYKGKS